MVTTMWLRRILGFCTGWSDFLMSVAEAAFLGLRMYGVTRRIVERHYRDPTFRPWAKELQLGLISERTGRIREAEEHYRRVIRPGDEFGHLCLGEFYERQGQLESAVRCYETALTLVFEDGAFVKELRQRLNVLRHKANAR
jgi:hypothetical protein